METQVKSAHQQLAFFDRIANRTTPLRGRSGAFLTAFSVVIIWALTRPLFRYSDDWQLALENLTEKELTEHCQHDEMMAEVIRSAIDLRKSHSVKEVIEKARQKLTVDLL